MNIDRATAIQSSLRRRAAKRTEGSQQRVVRRHATVVKDGYEVPLIGIPPDAVLETCDLCGNQYGMAELVLSGTQMLCKKCAS